MEKDERAKCGRCRRKGATVAPRRILDTDILACDPCMISWEKAKPWIFSEWKRGALYVKEGSLFLAGGGSYGGILRGSLPRKDARE